MLRYDIKELVGMFDYYRKLLREADEEAVEYMVEEQKKEIEEQKQEIQANKREIEEKKQTIEEQKQQIEQQFERIRELEAQLARNSN